MKIIIPFCIILFLSLKGYSQCTNSISPTNQAVACTGTGQTVSFTVTALSPTTNIRHNWYSPLNPLPGGVPVLTSTNAVSVLSGSFSPGVYTVVTTDLGNLCQISKTFTITSLYSYPEFSLYCPTNFSTGCSSNQTTISIINPVSTQTPPSVCSFTFLPPSFPGPVPTGVLGNNTSTVVTALGNWTVIVIDNFNLCRTILPVPVSMSSVIANFAYTVNPGGQVSFQSTSTGTNGGTVFNWNFGDGNTASGQSTSNTYTASGVYNVNLTMSGNSCYTVIPVNVNIIPTGIKNNAGLIDFVSIFPNPANTSIYFKNTIQKTGNITIFNLAGEKIETFLIEKEQELKVEGLNEGIYFIEIRIENFVSRKKIAVMH